MEQGRTILSWKAPIRPEFNRTKRWYVISTVLAFTVAVYGIISGGWTITLVTALTVALYYILHNHALPLSEAIITNTGVQIGNKIVTWEEMDGFWFLPTGSYTELHIVPSGKWSNDLVIQTGDIPAEVIAQALSEHTKQLTDKTERFIDTFIRICKL